MYFLLMSAALSASSMVGDVAPYTDVPTTDAAGNAIIIRTSPQPDFSGGTVMVEQRLRPLGGGRYEIDPAAQSAATKIYHQILCEEKGMKPHMVKGLLSGDMAVGGFSCYSDVPLEEAPSSEADGDVDGSSTGEVISSRRAVDSVIAYAPNGRALVGANFLALGTMRISSSIAGRVAYEVSVDNRRCLFENVEYRDSAPFWMNIEGEVSCISHRPGALATVAKACIPKLCGSSTGLWSISQ